MESVEYVDCTSREGSQQHRDALLSIMTQCGAPNDWGQQISELSAVLGCLSQIDLSSCKLSDEMVSLLASALQNNVTVMELDLSHTRLGARGTPALCEMLTANSCLTDLNLDNTGLELQASEVFNTLLNSLQTNKGLRLLSLCQNTITTQGAAALAMALQVGKEGTNQSIEAVSLGRGGCIPLIDIRGGMDFDLSNRNFDEFELTFVATLLKMSESRVVDLGHNSIGNQDCSAALFDMLRSNSSITELRLSCCGMGDEAVAAIAVAFLESNTTLQQLVLSGDPFLEHRCRTRAVGDRGAEALAAALCSPNQVISRLDLSQNRLSFDGALAMGSMLELNHSLFHLSLAANNINSEGAAALAVGLTMNCTLLELDLSNNSVHLEGACALAEALKQNKTLFSLLLSDCGLGDDGAAVLASALRVNSSLGQLDLDGNGFTDLGLLELAHALEVNRGLTNIELWGHQGGEATNKAFALTLQGCPAFVGSYFALSSRCQSCHRAVLHPWANTRLRYVGGIPGLNDFLERNRLGEYDPEIDQMRETQKNKRQRQKTSSMGSMSSISSTSSISGADGVKPANGRGSHNRDLLEDASGDEQQPAPPKSAGGKETWGTWIGTKLWGPPQRPKQTSLPAAATKQNAKQQIAKLHSLGF